MTHTYIRLIKYYVCIVPIFVIGTASAQIEPGDGQQEGPESEVSLGLGIGLAPEYLGAKSTRVQPVPVVFIRQGDFYLDSVLGLGYRHETKSGLFFSQVFNWDPGRTDHDSNYRPGSDRLRGMGTVKGSLVTTTEMGYSITPWLSVHIQGEFALTARERGNRYALGLEGGLWRESKDDVWYAVNAHFADGRFVQSWFGVSRTQSAASGFPGYTPNRGLYAHSASLNWEHRFTRHWSTLVSVNAIKLTGNAGKSPIVQESFNTYALATVNYTF